MEEMLNEEELILIVGGASTKINATLINAIVRGATLLFDIGKSFGSTLRRTKDSNYCR